MKITMQDIRAGGGCAWGLREFFKRYDLDFKAFIKNGWIDAFALRSTGDALAISIVTLAEKNKVDGE